MIDYFKFPGGEVHVNAFGAYTNTIRQNIRNSDELMAVLLYADALSNMGQPKSKLKLDLRYLPYARQDRVAAPGDPLSIKVLADVINTIGAAEVIVWDCHSPVGLALINNITHVPQYMLAAPLLKGFDSKATVLVSPDSGATKKTYELAKALGGMQVIEATKIRDPSTGVITGTKVLGEVNKNLHYVIVDDICDGGATFIKLAQELDVPNLSLYVTHGIFSKGLEVLKPWFKEIFVANLLGEEDDFLCTR